MKGKCYTLLFLLVSVAVSAQQTVLHIRGSIKSADAQEPIIGAVIQDTLSKAYSISDEYGFFTLSLPGAHGCLRTQYIGYKPQLICEAFEEGQAINIELSTSNFPPQVEEVLRGGSLGNQERIKSEKAIGVKWGNQTASLRYATFSGAEPFIENDTVRFNLIVPARVTRFEDFVPVDTLSIDSAAVFIRTISDEYNAYRASVPDDEIGGFFPPQDDLFSNFEGGYGVLFTVSSATVGIRF